MSLYFFISCRGALRESKMVNLSNENEQNVHVILLFNQNRKSSRNSFRVIIIELKTGSEMIL